MTEEKRSKLRSLAVFCGSHHGRNPAYRAAAKALGTHLGARGIELIYGGGNVGLMGTVADATMAAGGTVVGVIPQALKDREVAHEGVTRLEVVDSMHVRKQRMYELADALVALPGGIGTFEELLESMTWIQLGLHAKPCGLLNTAGYYDPLLAQLDAATDEGFVSASNRTILVSEREPDAILDRLERHTPPPVARWIRADET